MIIDGSVVDEFAKKFRDTQSGSNSAAIWFARPYSPKMPFIHKSVVATPGRMPGINSRQRVQNENPFRLMAIRHSAKMMGGMSAFARSVRRKINIGIHDCQKLCVAITLLKFSNPIQ